jgi:VanZ family protein
MSGMTYLPSRATPATASVAPRADQAFARKAFWAFATAALIFYASSRSHVAAPGFTRIDDKFGHFGVYGLLGTLVCRLTHGWRGALVSLVIVSAYGATDEWHQSFVPGRAMDVQDWIADTIGAAIAVVLYTGWSRYRRWLETPVWPSRARVEKSTAGGAVGGQ